ncbi:MAG: DUF5320 domain-containing protein [Desulfobacterales bacterium]|nr:DUF5320 domain-containing protein [Desulfobacterales bacterium]MBS3755200.1 DUF5320 domain-containing protein [Desulfobacterales bacterium]
MPRGDGTGPQGQGPMTGRGMGGCGPDLNRTPNAGQPDARRIRRAQGPGPGRRLTNGFNNIRRRLRIRRFGRGRSL